MPDARVIVVVDRDYGALMRLLPEEVPAWVVDSPKNHEVILELWDSRKRWNQSGVLTSFQDKPALSPENLLISNLDMIDLHQGAYSQDPPWSIAQIIGVRPIPYLIEAMKILGFPFHRQIRDEIEFSRQASESVSVQRG